jgi:REP element-mobilizing transposase RayT
LRLRGHDYRSPGSYLITVCADNWEPLFGVVIDGEMRLNEYGWIVQVEWLRTPRVRPYASADSFVVMPNHFHGILVLADEQTPAPCNEGMFGKPVVGSVGVIVDKFKAAVTKRINHVRGMPAAQVWESNYSESILRTEDEVNLTRHYIDGNPAHWPEDPDNRPPAPLRFPQGLGGTIAGWRSA